MEQNQNNGKPKEKVENKVEKKTNNAPAPKKAEAPKVVNNTPKTATPKVENKKVEAPKVETAKAPAQKVTNNTQKTETPKVAAPKTEAPKTTANATKPEENAKPKKEKKAKKGKGLKIFLVILVLLGIAGGVVYYLYSQDIISFDFGNDSSSKASDDTRTTSLDLNGTATPDADVTASPEASASPDATASPDQSGDNNELSITELNNIKKYLDKDKAALLVGEFKDPKEASLYMALQYGTELKSEKVTKQEEMIYFAINKEDLNSYLQSGKTLEEYIEGIREIMGDPLKKFSKENLNKYLKNNLGVSVDEVNTKFLTYIDKFDSYYMNRANDALMRNITVLGGKKENDVYTISYKDNYEYKWTLKLKKDGDSFIILSNVNDASAKIEEINNVKGLNKVEGNYNKILKYYAYYKGNDLYYVAVYNTSSGFEQLDGIYYYEDNRCIADVTESMYLEQYYDYEYMGKELYKMFVANK